VGTHAASRMAVPVIAVVSDSPVSAAGLRTTFQEAGYPVQVPGDAGAWMTHHPQGAVVLTHPPGDDWRRLSQLRAAQAAAPILVILNAPTVTNYHQALHHGATGVATWDDTPARLTDALAAAVQRRCTLPTAVVHALIPQRPPHLAHLTDADVQWLKHLAGGDPIEQIAAALGYCRRTAQYHLRRLYDRIGVDGRAQAVAHATELGLTTRS
jgi:DNA-binding NarL/FixJ family response regulator